MKLLLVGGTGLVGSEVLKRALAEPRIETLVVPARRPLDISHDKRVAPLVDFEALPADASWWQVDAAICTLGTTIKAAGSREAFRKVDHNYPLAVARLAKAHGASRLAVVTAKGANSRSPFFYSRVKGELEADLAALGFPSLTLVRPGLIGGERTEGRVGEDVAKRALELLGPILPRSWRVNPASTIAQALIDAAVAGRPGSRIIGSAESV
jgi:uncharacterized protein YbjT (DUF2867 family)